MTFTEYNNDKTTEKVVMDNIVNLFNESIHPIVMVTIVSSS